MAGKPRIRPLALEEAPAFSDLYRSAFGEMDIAKWKRKWEAHPFKAEFRDTPVGWVLEREDGSIAGLYANVHILYELEGRRLRGCVGSDWVVARDARGSALVLLHAFLRQTNVELRLVSSASPATAEILTRLKVARIPAEGYDCPMIWPLRARAFAEAALKKKGVKGAGVLAWPAAAGLRLVQVARGMGNGARSSAVRRQDKFDERFDEFWEQLRADPVRLRAVRNQAALEWRFPGPVTILIAARGSEMTGYAVLERRPSEDLSLNLSYVADLQVVGDDRAILSDLLKAALDCAREDGADGLKLSTANLAKRAAAQALHPYSYRVPLWQLYYSAREQELGRRLASPELWDFSLIDNF